MSEWGDIGECDHCDKEGIPVSYEVDPFIHELYPEDENEPSYWCWDCYGDRHDEV